MGWHYIADKNGDIEILVTRWNNYPPPKGLGPLEVRLVASGFEPNELVDVEIMADLT